MNNSSKSMNTGSFAADAAQMGPAENNAAGESDFQPITEAEINALGTYEIEEHRFLPDINSDSYVLKHKKTGARVAILPNSDSNKVFYIGFRTPPKDSTGVAHIIEHTVLCGSRDFPVKDPFIEVVKGSLNTFLNAMTYPDKTVYPVASTNEKDFDNLMHVYLDAVFHPNIYEEQNIFRQEGWHYEAVADENGHFDDQSPITVNGVVYNEMKGVMSSPDDVLNDKILKSLYPDTTYAIVSGGDPDVIPTLRYEDYLDFHRKYYHPSNSYIYLYGDMDMKERLTYLDEAYLSHYDNAPVDSAIRPQRAFTHPVEEQDSYSVMADEDTKGKTYLSLNYHIPVENNPKDELGFKILDYILCDAEGAPVKEALRRKGIGQDVSSLFDAGILHPYYSITAKYADPEQKEEFLRTIEETLTKLADEGIDEKSWLAGVNYYEFHYREAEFGSYPKGLVFGLDALDTWLYDDKAVWTNLDIGKYFDEIREEAQQGYFEALIRRYLLENPHRSVVLLTPEQGLTQKKDAALAKRMADYAASLTPAQRHAITEETAALRKWQETPDSREALDTIPVLERRDLKREILPYVNEVKWSESGTMVLAHPFFTSNIDYMTFMFDISKMPARLFHYLVVFKTLLGVLDTEQYTYAGLDHEINIVTGGIAPSAGTYGNAKNVSEYRVMFEVHAKTMHANADKTFDLVLEMLTHTKYTDLDRIREVLEEERAGMMADMPASGHATAVTRATSYFSETSEIMDEISGIGAYRTLDEICRNFETEGPKLPAILQEMAEFIFRKENFFFDVTTDEDKINELLPLTERFAGELFGSASNPTDLDAAVDEAVDLVYQPELEKKNEGFTTAGQVQFVCRAGNFLDKGFRYTGALRVLKVIMGYDYLWQRIRMKGGAYGCMSGFARDGCAYFVTYRDPHLKSSIDTFEKAADYIRSFQADDRTMTKYVIGAVSALDRPLSPQLQGRYSATGYLTNYSEEDMQRERDQVLDADVEDIRALGDLVAAFMSDDALCVVGSADKISQNKELFGTVQPLC